MANFIFAYHGGKKPETPEESAQIMAQWNTWLDSLGDAVINPGTPVGGSKIVSAGGIAGHGGANPLSGFSIISATDMDAALAIAQSCPHVDYGTIEVAEMMHL